MQSEMPQGLHVAIIMDGNGCVWQLTLAHLRKLTLAHPVEA
jgi:hypothetical protein